MIKENEEIKIKCLYSNDGNPQPNNVKFVIGEKLFIKKPVCLRFIEIFNLKLYEVLKVLCKLTSKQ